MISSKSQTRVVEDPLIVPIDRPGSIGHPGELRDGIGQGAEALLTLLNRLLDPDALHGDAQDVGHALQKGGVSLGELILLWTVDFKDAEGPLAPADRRIDGTANAMLDHDLRSAEPVLTLGRGGSEMTGQHGFTGAERIAGRRAQVGSRARMPDHAGPPADAGPHQEFVLVRAVFEHFRQFAPEATGADPAGLLQEGIEIHGLQGKEAKARQNLLLPEPVCQFLGSLRHREEFGSSGR